MKKGYILWLLISVISLPVVAQNIIYSNLKELMVQDGDTLAVLRVEKRSRSQILLTGGADYRITAGNDESMCRQLKKRCFAVRTSEGDLFINCRKLRYKKMRFGAWYAPAVQLGKNIYFCLVFCVNDDTVILPVKIRITWKSILFSQINASFAFFVVGMLESLLCKDSSEIFFP